MLLEKELDNMFYYPLYKDRCNYLLEGEEKNYSLCNDYENFKDLMSIEAFKEIMRFKNARQHKRNRVDAKFFDMQRVENLYQKEGYMPYIVFGTMTLRDDILNLKEDTYIRKIHRYLEKHYKIAILNKDFGKTTEREHYHFIALTVEPIERVEKRSKTGRQMYELKHKDYELGFEPNLLIIDTNDKKKVREYLLKLNNHTTKESTKQTRIRVIMDPMVKLMFKRPKNKGEIIAERYLKK